MRIGIDLGGSKAEAVALGNDGKVLAQKRIDTPRGDYLEILRTVVRLINTLEKETGRRGEVGIGTPGAISPVTGLLRNSNSTELNGHCIRSDLEALLGRPVRIANDANCFALSEATDGAAEGASVVFGVILGTGTGAGVVVNGHILTGPNAIAGEWGHNPLPWPRAEELPGPDCYCGRQGCVETFLSGPGFAADYGRASGAAVLAPEVVKLAESGNAEAEAAMQRYEGRLARGLAHVINVLDPDVIVLGGGMSNAARLYTNVPELWGEFIFSDTVTTRLLPPRFGDASGVRGAAWLWDGG